MAEYSTRFHPVGLDKREAAPVDGAAEPRWPAADLARRTSSTPRATRRCPAAATLSSIPCATAALLLLRHRDGQITLLCWGFSAEGVDFGADALVGFQRLRRRAEGAAHAAGAELWLPRRAWASNQPVRTMS